jgi:CBS-domain-containing membrane protein
MTAPAITVGPGVTIPAAARLMSAHHVRMLPIVDEDGVLAGIVSRRDLLGVFLRPDEEIAADVRRVLDEVLPADPADPAGTDVTVRDGIVTLTGTSRSVPGHDLIPLAIRLMWDVDGVVDIDDRLSPPPSPVPAQAGRHQEQGNEE